MSFFTSAAKGSMLTGLIVDRVQIHSGDPGVDGTNLATSDLTTCAFALPTGGYRALNTDTAIAGMDPNASAAWFSVWNWNSGTPVFIGAGAITSGDVTANAAGEYTLTTGTQLQINDPA